MAALFDVTLTQEELAYLLRLFKLVSLPGLPPDWATGLNEREMAFVLSAGKRSLRARSLLTYDGQTPVIERAVAAIFGAIVQTQLGLVVNRMTQERAQTTLFCMMPDLKIAYTMQEGLYDFCVYEASSTLEQAVWKHLTGDQATQDFAGRQPMEVPMSAILVTRLNTLMPDAPVLNPVLQTVQQDSHMIAALSSIFGPAFQAICLFGAWLTSDESQHFAPQMLIQTQGGWWHMQTQDNTCHLSPLTEADLMAAVQKSLSFEIHS